MGPQLSLIQLQQQHQLPPRQLQQQPQQLQLDNNYYQTSTTSTFTDCNNLPRDTNNHPCTLQASIYKTHHRMISSLQQSYNPKCFLYASSSSFNFLVGIE